MTQEQYDKIVETIDECTLTEKCRRKNPTIIYDVDAIRNVIRKLLWKPISEYGYDILKDECDLALYTIMPSCVKSIDCGWNDVREMIIGDNIIKLKSKLRRLINAKETN